MIHSSLRSRRSAVCAAAAGLSALGVSLGVTLVVLCAYLGYGVVDTTASW